MLQLLIILSWDVFSSFYRDLLVSLVCSAVIILSLRVYAVGLRQLD